MAQQDFQSQQPEVLAQKFGIDIKSIVEMFSSFLYSDHNVVIRELISNASDSCVRREDCDPNCQPRELRLDIYYRENSIVLEDTGAGMTREEIENHLATIGAGGTKLLRDELLKRGQDVYARKLIGKFGLGFLSAFVVADRVVVETKSFQNGSPAYRWICDGHQYYELGETIDKDEVGTRIILKLKPEFTHLLNPLKLKQLILDFLANVALPIYLHPVSPLEPLNKLAPWYQDIPPNAKECREFLVNVDEKRFEGAKTALAVIPVYEPDLDLRGVLYIPPWSSKTEGVVDIYCKRVLVHRDDLLLIPETVLIVRGCIDCYSFSLTIDRERVIPDTKFKEVQKRIEKLVVDCLKNLAREREDNKEEEYASQYSAFPYIMNLHGKALKQGALGSTDNQYFLAIAENLIFSSNKNEHITLPQYVENAKKNPANRKPNDQGDQNTIVVFYNRDIQGKKQLKEVLSVQNVEILDATDGDSLDFIIQYTKKYIGSFELEARSYEGLLERPLPEDDSLKEWNEITRFYNSLRHSSIELTAKAVPFEPKKIPLLIVPSEGNDNLDSEKLLEYLHLIGSSSKVDKIKEILFNHSRNRIVYVNTDNSLMRGIKEHREKNFLDPETFHLVLHELFHNALILANEQVDSDHLLEYHEKVIAGLCNESVQATKRSQELISAKTQINDIQKERDSLLAQIAKIKLPDSDLGALNSKREVFVMRPYDNDSTARYHKCILPACQEQELQVVDLENRVEPGRIPEEINRHIIECAILIGDMTDASPNVMYEIGAAHMLGKENQTILITREASTIPFDLRGFRVITFRNDTELLDLSKEISKYLKEIKHAMDVEQDN